MLRVSRANRAVLAGAAFASFAGSFVTTPFTARGDAGLAPQLPTRPAPSATVAAVAAVLPRRDPFAGDPPVRRNDDVPPFARSHDADPSQMPALPPFPASGSIAAGATIPAALVPLPPNLSASGTPLSTAGASAAATANAVSSAGAPAAVPSQPDGTIRVTAVVTGARPYALVDDGRTARLVTVGDRIGGDTLAAITAEGVRFSRGRVVPLSPASSSTRSQPGGP
jgi:hypothetical protein